MSTLTDPTHAARQELGRIDGEVITPDDSGYDEARRVYNAMIDRRPALVVRCATEDDVIRVVRFAREHQLPLAVRGGGHNGAGSGTVDDGVVLDLSSLDEVTVDAEARTARVGGGATWGQVDQATNAHGLATPSGLISTTGVGGLTLGGGMGHLSRRYGLTVDNLLGADVVLASGERVHASDEEHPDLFWAIRGGGGNFGVVTSFELRLHELSTVVAGPTFWPVESAAEVLRVYRDFLPSAPRDLNGLFVFASVPPGPPFPEELHLRKVCGVVWCHTGTEEAAAADMAPMLDALPEPLLHGPAPMSHPTFQSAFDAIYPRGDQQYWRGDFVDTIPDEAIAIHAEFGARMPTWKSTMHLSPIDGAVHDVDRSDTAWGHRDATWSTVYFAVDPDPGNAEAIRAWCVDYFEALHPYSAGGAYVNFMMDEGQERVRASYGDNYDRLARVKATYDPGNLFHINQNIEPYVQPA